MTTNQTKAPSCCCRVDSDNAVNLNDILNSFKAPMKEEHTWALCYQCIRFFMETQATNNEPSFLVRTMNDIYLRTDGNVHSKTSYTRKDNRPRVCSESEIIMGLGMVLYSTLDYCYKQEEERIISEPLAQLMNDMIENVSETDDEGIERDSEEDLGGNGGKKGIGLTQMTLKDVLQRCEVHVAILTKAQTECHYKAVVRALVTEALELSTFLDIVAQGIHLTGTEQCSTRDLDQLQFMDWSSVWLTVIAELRMGVKLKKVNYGRAPIEYELTPYEILMKDIRNYKQNLRKVRPENVGRHARDIILEFIRSRPPLKKASERKLAPKQPKYYSPREQLMQSIRKGQKLRKTQQQQTHQLLQVPYKDGSHNKSNTCHSKMDVDVDQVDSCGDASSVSNYKQLMMVQNDDSEGSSSTKRRLISVDFSLIDCDDNMGGDDDGDDYDSDEEMNLWADELAFSDCRQNTIARRTIVDKYDLAMGSGYGGGYRYIPRLTSAENGTTTTNPSINHLLNAQQVIDGSRSVPQSRPISRQSCPEDDDNNSASDHPAPATSYSSSATTTVDQLLSLDNRLSLTLEEIVHIRTVLTRAEIEALPMEAHVRANVENRKVCFLCLKTKFGVVFGQRSYKCVLCQCTVCGRCCGRMRRIPTEHFARVPVVLLSPNIMATPEGVEVGESDSFFPSAATAASQQQNSSHADRSIPDTTTTSSSTSSKSPSRCRANTSLDRFRRRTAGTTTTTTTTSTTSSAGPSSLVDRLRADTSGDMMIVCHDCRAMVLQIIKSAQANRSAIRNKHLQTLTLDLSPMF